MHGLPLQHFGLILSLLLLTTSISAQRPGPVHPPLCPYSSELAGRGRVFLRCWYDYSGVQSNGGYLAFTQPHMWDNLTVTDITDNYPAPEGKGTKLPPFGEYAKSRVQFSSVHENYVPKFNEIFKYTLDGNLPSFGYRDETDCLTYHWESSYLGTLLKPYGGKPAGAKVSWKHTYSFKTRHPLPNEDDGTGYLIQNATVKMDWSSWYTP
ncbi:hypothetical protein GJ744_006512 [Endocarpon pusillum]|uniref:Uncharacterized protein n=1 Tax=Endocarpon pusillum TaxID=364733 RepID=A0A8H7EA47_9EURO|nr:hypothetical protein GJ744_006512 [Endocarpon pusillum]